MKGTLSNVLIFAAGAAIGSVVTWKLIKTKYEQIAREEINSVKERIAKRTNRAEQQETTPDCVSIEIDNSVLEDLKEYEREVRRQEYTGYPGEDDEEDDNVMCKPYVISPDEFGEMDDYECESLIYYADQVLADTADNMIEDVEGLVGRESLGHFGEYEDDSVFVRNDRLRTDFEILRDISRYEDMVNAGPRPTED